MLSIRMQRLGRKGHPTYRVVVQDSRQAPASGKYVAMLGSYDPHTKQNTLVKEKAEFYLKNGAQPSERVVSLFRSEKITIPKWVKESTKHERTTRNPEKLRKNRPAEAAEAASDSVEAAKPEEQADTKAEDSTEEAVPAPAEKAKEDGAEESPTDESSAEKKPEKSEAKTESAEKTDEK